MDNKLNNIRAAWIPEFHNLDKAKSYIEQRIREIDEYKNELITSQRLLNDLYTLDIYKDILLNNHVFDKLFKISIYIK